MGRWESDEDFRTFSTGSYAGVDGRFVKRGKKKQPLGFSPPKAKPRPRQRKK